MTRRFNEEVPKFIKNNNCFNIAYSSTDIHLLSNPWVDIYCSIQIFNFSQFHEHIF